MAEPALDDDQRDAFVGHLDGVSVPQLMRGKAPAARPLGRQSDADQPGRPRSPNAARVSIR